MTKARGYKKVKSTAVAISEAGQITITIPEEAVRQIILEQAVDGLRQVVDRSLSLHRTRYAKSIIDIVAAGARSVVAEKMEAAVTAQMADMPERVSGIMTPEFVTQIVQELMGNMARQIGWATERACRESTSAK